MRVERSSDHRGGGSMKGAITKHVSAFGMFAVVLWVAGCGGGSNTSSSTADKGPLQVWTMEDSASFTSLMQDFTRQTGIPVQVEAVPRGNGHRNATPRGPSGNAPDPF